MSQLKKALEKARHEGKALNTLYRRQALDPEVAPISEVDNGKDQEVVVSDQEKITPLPPTYSHTRSVKVDHSYLVEHKVISILEKDEIGDQYKLLRTMILNQMRPKGYTSLVVTSFGEGEGKSHVCINLAFTLAKESRQNVLLVDMDLRRPSVHSTLGIEPRPGLKDYFTSAIPIKEMLINPGIDRLTILPAGGRMENSSEVISSHRMEALINELKNRYQDRYIVFDAPALNTCSDPLVLSTYTDTILLVARAGKTTTAAITSGMALVKDRNVLGVVLNECGVRRGWTY